GSHGAEFWYPGEGARTHADEPDEARLRDELRERAEAATSGLAGVWIEPKRFGLGVHTRKATPADAFEANRLVDAMVAAEAPAWRRRTGHNIIEYAFRHEGKDSAVAELRAHTDASAVLFAGDDVTDEDALRSLTTTDLGVHVGSKPTAATLCVPDIAALAAVLAVIAGERSTARQ
ncbi:MAG: trehalose-phosphatase, partial [Microbacterium sp.]